MFHVVRILLDTVYLLRKKKTLKVNKTKQIKTHPLRKCNGFKFCDSVQCVTPQVEGWNGQMGKRTRVKKDR